jgi:5-methylcytosine-specific restriction endonuclease McrA
MERAAASPRGWCCPRCKGVGSPYEDSVRGLCCPFCLYQLHPPARYYCGKCATHMAHEKCPVCERLTRRIPKPFVHYDGPNTRKDLRSDRPNKGNEQPYPLSKRVLKLAERDKWICHLCGKPVDPDMLVGNGRATADHLHPRSLGGSNALRNLALAHKGCNNRRGNRPLSGPSVAHPKLRD